jgi:hydrogenase maturation protein HypF
MSRGDVVRLRVEVRGAVQGVGFRPFVYRLAGEHALAGWVLNDARGVDLEVEGPQHSLEAFLAALRQAPPRSARIRSLEAAWLAPAGYAAFEIRASEPGGPRAAVLLPDLATCDACLAEVLDPADRRAGYAFANCTECGPRFTIVRALPYDRPNTTMAAFALCDACRAEYTDPADRRFHAQPVACPACGPQLTLTDVAGVRLAVRGDALERTVAALADGAIVAVKGLGGFHLMCDATHAAAVAALRAGKPRREKPFALMVRDLGMARALCDVDDAAAAMLGSPAAPIVLLPRRAGAPSLDGVAPGLTTLGVMLPATPLHHLLLRAVARPLVATSGNRADEPIATDGDGARARLGDVAALVLDHDRPIERHADDSVGRFIGGTWTPLRRARGFAPLPVALPHAVRPVLAVGAHQKCAIALAVGREAFVSQHLGDLDTPEALAAFERVIADFTRMYDVRPEVVAHDLHPDYASTRWALASGVPALAVQHHHAHLAACLAEHGAPGRALGVTWDGTGLGLDGTIWGGEFLLGDAAAFTRVARLRPFRLPGGDAAAREPRRAAFALLHALVPATARTAPQLASFTAAEHAVLARMCETGAHAPMTTSAGRLFDGLAALLGLHAVAGYEGQAAMALEALADGAAWARDYAMPVHDAGDALELDWGPLVEAVATEAARGVDRRAIALGVHVALAQAIADVATRVGESRVALSGGCMQNRVLVEHAERALRAHGHRVLRHREVPPNDGGIALGQIAIAAARS